MKRHKVTGWLPRAYIALLGMCFAGGILLVLVSSPVQPPPQQQPLPQSQVSATDNTSAIHGTDTTETTPEPTSSAAATNTLPAAPHTNRSGQPQPAPVVAPSQSEPHVATPDPPPETIRASLLVNDAHKGEVILTSGASHCDLLSQALASGALSSLEMRYNAQHKSHGVYVIDGIGDSDTVWWTYEVNGSPPPLGCSHITVNHGDTVHWKYQRR